MTQRNDSLCEIHIRRIPKEKLIRLKRQAKKQGKTLQDFMYEQALRLADGEEIVAVQYKMLEQQSQLAQIIQANTEALLAQENRWRALLGEEE